MKPYTEKAVDRNPLGKWRDMHHQLERPVRLDKNGLFWIHAFDGKHYRKGLSEVIPLDWNGFIQELIDQIVRLDKLITRLIRDYPGK